MKTQLLRFLKHKSDFDFVFCVALAISLFLCFTLEIKTIFILFVLVFAFGLLNKLHFLFLSFVLFAFAYLVYLYTKPISLEDKEIINGVFKVKNRISSGLIIKVENQNVLLLTKEKIGLFSSIEIKGKIEQPQNYSSFDFISYLKTKNIANVINNPEIKIVSQSNDLRNQAMNFLTNGPSNYLKIAPLILLGQRTLETKEVYDLALNLSVLHLFVISGFHISLFYFLFKKLLTFCKVKESYAALFALLPIFFYLFLLNFPLSASRATCLVFCSYVNKFWFKKYFSSLTLFAFVLGVFFVWKPFALTSLSFIFTFMATFFILLINGLKIKNKSLKYLLVFVGAYFANFLILLYLNQWFSAWGIFYSLFLSPLFVLMYLSSLLLFSFQKFTW